MTQNAVRILVVSAGLYGLIHAGMCAVMESLVEQPQDRVCGGGKSEKARERERERAGK